MVRGFRRRAQLVEGGSWKPREDRASGEVGQGESSRDWQASLGSPVAGSPAVRLFL